MATTEEPADWAGETGQVSRYRGRAFEAVCLAAVSFALVSVLVLLLYVAADAFRPFDADPALSFEIAVMPVLELFTIPVVLPFYLLVFFVTLVVPAAATLLYCYRLDEPAGEVAYVTTGLPVLGTLVAGGFMVVVIELVTVLELFALAVATGVAVLAVKAHARLRPHAALERLAVVIAAPALSIGGVPPAELTAPVNWLAGQVGLPSLLTVRVLSVREAILAVPVLPADWLLLVLVLTVPVAGGLGTALARRRESRRDGLAFVALAVLGASLGIVAGPALGFDAAAWVVIFSWTVPLLAFYVEGVVRRGEGLVGLAFPVVVVAGLVVGVILVRQFGFGLPDPWLDWSFLTSVHSRTPEDAGFYPPIVGSVMMLVVIGISAFPVGVGAAIFLEEYAPTTGFAGRLVELVEVNIGNLAGVPSVVYGLLALALFIRYLHMPTGAVIVGGLAVGLLILPIVIIAAQEAIRAVPDTHRQASSGLGATRWQTVRDVVLPQALPGILTGTILAVGRAIGETAPLLMIGAASSVRLAPNGFFDQLPAMPRQIFAWSTNLDPEIRHGVLAAGVVTLLAVLLIMNGTAIILRNKYQREA